jgi:hypothetical protein
LNKWNYSILQKCCPQSEWRVFATTFAVSFFPQREWQNFATRGAVKTCQLSAREKNEEKVDCSSMNKSFIDSIKLKK